MFSQIISLLALTGATTAASLHRRDSPASNVTVVSLEKTTNSTGGQGNVAIGGVLNPFGSIGAGCGINWNDGVAYGGGLQAGSDAFGLGGGFKITPTTLEVGTGIGLNPSNSSADVTFTGHTNGTFQLRFASSSPFACVPSNEEGSNVVVCTTY
ncbi:hypothetical protein PRZ48_003411 [Zasmidium cellare]|uniref:Uncharacterized protein n=1 Tax=Zasmidium cellare TaxID=395010 RepID=A0ABR0EX70_ZASCE|nr:hypothetical protein PRZ48_003411 [Zasmidium cellare]